MPCFRLRDSDSDSEFMRKLTNLEEIVPHYKAICFNFIPR